MARKPKKKPLTTDDTLIALYAHLLIGKQRAVKAAQKRLAAMQKEAAQNGVAWPEVKAALAEYDLTTEQRRAFAERQAKIYNAIGIPAQLEMFDAYVPRVNDSEEAARRRGYFACVMHQSCEPPFDAGSSEGQAWIRGWSEMQAQIDGYNNRFAVGAEENEASDSGAEAEPEETETKDIEEAVAEAPVH